MSTNGSSSPFQLPEWYMPLTDTTSIIAYVLSAFIILGNSVTVAAILKYRKLQTNTNVLVCSLSFSDITLGIFTIVSRVYIYHTNVTYMLVIIIFLYSSYHISVSHLFIIALERYVAIIHPFQYEKYVSKGTIALSLTLVWIIPLIFWSICWPVKVLTGQNRWVETTGPALYLLQGFVLVIMYIRILIVAYQQASKIRQLNRQNMRKNKFKSELKATKTLAVIVFAYVIFWSPVCLDEIISSSAPTQGFPTLKHMARVSAFLLWATLNSGVNCIVYAWFNKDFRQAYLRLLQCGGKRFGRKVESINDPTSDGTN